MHGEFTFRGEIPGRSDFIGVVAVRQSALGAGGNGGAVGVDGDSRVRRDCAVIGQPDNERLERAICHLTGCKQCVITYDALRGLAQVLRENQFHVQAVADCSGECCTVYALLPPEPAAHACAVAIDIR